MVNQLNRLPIGLLAQMVEARFEADGKRHLFLTGSKGVGKSTLCYLLADNRPVCGRITTAAERTGGLDQRPKRVVLQDSLHRRAVIGLPNPLGPGMLPCPEGFEQAGVEMLRQFRENRRAWLVVDEIGYLEECAPHYQQELRLCLDEKRVLAVLRKGDTPFVRELRERPDACCIDLDGLLL